MSNDLNYVAVHKVFDTIYLDILIVLWMITLSFIAQLLLFVVIPFSPNYVYAFTMLIENVRRGML